MEKPKFVNVIREDYSNYCQEKLREIEPLYSELDLSKRVLDYHRYKFRKISPVPRQVFVASNFNCPPQFQATYNKISSAIQKGESLFPYQSRMLKSTDYDDAMLMDWGVQHLHLGDTIEADGFAKRTNELLFVRVTHDCAYIIGIFKHKEWSNLDVIEVLHSNWPISIASFKLKGIAEISFTPTADELSKMRNANVNSFITTLDGTIYMGPGMGVTGAGTPTKVQFDIAKLQRLFDKDFKTIESQYDLIRQKLDITEDNEQITVGLMFQDDKIIYVFKEINKGIILN
jgi:hypothetical protein